MDEDRFYIVTEDGAPVIEEVPALDGKAAIVCVQPDLAEEGEKLERITYGDLAVVLQARDDIEYVRIRTYEGPKMIDKPNFLGHRVRTHQDL